MIETYRIKVGRRGLPGSTQSRITEPYALEDLHQMFSAYMTEGLIVDLSPREVKLVETAASALERLKKVEASQEDEDGEQGNSLLDRANATIKRLEAKIKRLREALAPFAKAAEKIPDFGPHAKAIEDILAVNWKDGSLPMFGTEFHRARAALGGGG